ncbi:MAG: Crp/Fnr family transcriptional regulator [Thermoflexaceae bacterium]|nr:Crp/Fnr family transcriptional regulator [Thermoflexaceae bacterium]
MAKQLDQGALADAIGALPLFQGLGNSLRCELARRAVWREYLPGEFIFIEGEESPGLYYLESGWLKVVKSSPQGREQVLKFVGPGETFNEVGVFARRPNPASAVALETSGVWLLPRSELSRLVREHPEFAESTIGQMADRLTHLVGLVADLSLRTVTGRLARLLLDDSVNGVLYRPRWYTLAELASRLGTVPDVIQRAVAGLAGEGVIEVRRSEFRIRDRARLEDLAD